MCFQRRQSVFLFFMQLSLLLGLCLLPSAAASDPGHDGRRKAVSAFREQEDISPHACNIERLDGARLTSQIFKRRVASRTTPLLVYNLATWPQLKANVNEEALLSAYGDQLVPVEAGIDASRSYFKSANHLRKFRDYVLGGNPGSRPEVVLDTGLNYDFSRGVWREKERYLPSFLKDFDALPVVSVGTIATGLGMRQHNVSWSLALHGRQAWWTAERSAGDKRYFGRSSPCTHLGAELPSSYRFCVQQPGELLFLPDSSLHATCNIDELAFSIGGQGWSSSWPDLFRSVHKGDLPSLERELMKTFEPGHLDKGEGAVLNAALDRAFALDRVAVSRRIIAHLQEFLHFDALSEPLDRRMTGALLHAVLRAGNEDLAAELVDMGLSSHEPFNRYVNITVFESAAERGHTALLHMFGVKGQRLLDHGHGLHDHIHSERVAFLAAQAGHLTILGELKDGLGFDIRAPGEHNRLPLHGAAAGGHVMVAKALIGKKLHFLEAKDDQGHAPLHAAAEHGHAEMLNFLLEHGAHADVTSVAGWQPLHLAAMHGHASATTSLLEQRADATNKGPDSTTALHLAAEAGASSVVEVLIQGRASVSVAEDVRGMTPLQAAAQSGARFALESLINLRADVNAATHSGQRALHFAAEAGHSSLTELLLGKTPPGSERERLVAEAGRAAAALGQTEVLNSLVVSGWGKQLFTRDASGARASDLAAKHGHKAAVEFIAAVSDSSQARLSEL